MIYLKISVNPGSGFDDMDWLDKLVDFSPKEALDNLGKDGVEQLSKNTPRDTGVTASSWVFEVTSKGSISEIIWKNSGHPNAKVNLVRLIELGHGTGTGGYIPPNPFIAKSMEGIYNKAGDYIIKELRSK